MPFDKFTNRTFNNDMVKSVNEYLQSAECKNDRTKQATIAKELLPKHINEKDLLAMGKYFTSILDGGELVIASEENDNSEQKHYEQFMHKSEAQIKDLNTPPPKNGIAHASIDNNGRKHYEVNPNEAKRLDDILAKTPNKNMWEYA